jgi:hypothetical protein
MLFVLRFQCFLCRTLKLQPTYLTASCGIPKILGMGVSIGAWILLQAALLAGI